MQIQIRQAKPEDAESLLRIHQEAVEDKDFFIQDPSEFKGTVEGKRQQIERALDSGTSCLFVAEADGQVVGWLSLSGYELKKLSHVAMLGMAVAREIRGQGIGLQLVQAALNWAKKNSALRRVALAVFETNASAIAIYKKAGFEIEGVEKNEIQISEGTYVNQLIMGITW